MRSAYRGRAAAYEKKREYAKAIADHTMVVTYYAIEMEIASELNAPDRTKLLPEAAEAYLARGKCLEALGKRPAAEDDRKRAADLQSRAKPRTDAADTVAADQVRIINEWTGPVSLEIDGVTYTIAAGTRRDIPLPAASIASQVRTGPYLQTTTLRAGRTYTIR